MANEGVGKFIEKLREIIDKPPYLIFLFAGAVLVFISILSDKHFEQVWIFFLYSVAGTVWRYVEKDIRKNVLKTQKQKDISTIAYHLVNIVLLLLLIGLLIYESFR